MCTYNRIRFARLACTCAYNSCILYNRGYIDMHMEWGVFMYAYGAPHDSHRGSLNVHRRRHTLSFGLHYTIQCKYVNVICWFVVRVVSSNTHAYDRCVLVLIIVGFLSGLVSIESHGTRPHATFIPHNCSVNSSHKLIHTLFIRNCSSKLQILSHK